MNRLVVRALASCGFLAAAYVYPACAQQALPAGLVQSCEACHGEGGDSQRADVPRLNGQHKDYVVARLREFLDPTRGTAHANQMMWQNATRVSDDQAVALADYFSRQAPTPANGTGPQAATGGDIYKNGGKPDIPACAPCHGQAGEGLGATPRVAGQKENYLIAQLQAFMLTVRVGTSMNHHARNMTAEQIRAVSAYLAHN